MSKPIKNLIVDTYKNKFDGLTGAVVIDVRGIKSNQNNNLRADLAKDGIKVTVVKNSLARNAFNKTIMEGINSVLDGSNALVYGGESVVHVARILIDKLKALPDVQFKGAIMDGEMFGPKQIEALSKYPTKAEAQSQVISIVLGAAGQLISAFTGVGGQIVSIIEAVEKKREKEGPAAAAEAPAAAV